MAERIAALGAGERAPAAVYASPLERTRETARPIARRLGLRVRTDRGLLECDFGEWTGARLNALSKRRNGARSRGPRAASASRAVNPSSRCRPACPRPSPAWSASTGGRRWWPCPTPTRSRRPCPSAAGTPLDLFQRLVVSPCSVSAVAYGDGGPAVLTVNSTSSLAELAIG